MATATQLSIFTQEVLEQRHPLRFKIFLETPIGKLYQVIPFDTLAQVFKPYKSKHPQGVKSIFSIQGGLALQVLKHRYQLSNAEVVEMINGNWHFQYFCGIHLSDTQSIRDKDIVGRWHRYFSYHNGGETWKAFEPALVPYWKQEMRQNAPFSMKLDDATVFESYIKYPTDVGLIFDACKWVYKRIEEICAQAHIAKPRLEKFKKQMEKQVVFSKLRKRGIKKNRKRCKDLLYWLNKMSTDLQGLLNNYKEARNVIKGLEKQHCEHFFERFKTCKAINAQQSLKIEQPKAFKKIASEVIVSFYKPYLRAIVRGKTTKNVEFGAKAHISQVGGINFIEYLSFNAYHEGVRFSKSLAFHKKLTGQNCRQFAGDKLYANKRNRAFCKKQGIATCFAKQGNPNWKKKDTAVQEAETKMRKTLGVARSTRLEGSFGSAKNHHDLAKIKARNAQSEVGWIYLALLSANASIIAQKKFGLTKIKINQELLELKTKRVRKIVA